MADDADTATEIVELERRCLIENLRVDPDALSAESCRCGRVIPEARRASLPGVQNCVICQEQIERQSNGQR